MNTRSSSKNGVQYQWNSVNWFFHVLFQTCRRDVHVHVPCTVFEKVIRNKACKNRMFVEKCLYEYFIVDYKEIRALEVPYAFHHASRVYNIHMNFENCALNGRLTMKHGSKRGVREVAHARVRFSNTFHFQTSESCDLPVATLHIYSCYVNSEGSPSFVYLEIYFSHGQWT